MKKSKNKYGLALLIVGACAFLACSYDGTRSDAKVIETTIQDTTFLVNLKGTSISLGYDGVEEVQNEFFNELNFYIGKNNYTVTRTFDAINVVELKANSKYQDILGSLTNVTKVSIDQVYEFGDMTYTEPTASELEEGYVPQSTHTVNVDSADEDANQSAISMNVPESTNGGEGTVIAILDTGYLMDHEYFSDLDSGVDVKLTFDDICDATNNGLIATQTTTTEGELGSLYKNRKIPFYYDYAGSSNNSNNDNDVLTQISEHGTHVASIAAANGDSYAGIAPDAQLALMKVFYESLPTSSSSSASTYATDSDILEALQDCVVLGVDVLNMSLGSDLDDFDSRSTSMSVIDDLSADGVICAIAAGNAGKGMYSSLGGYKSWTTDMVDTGVLGSYGNSDSADIIASSTTEKLFYENGLQLGNSIVGYDDQVDYTDGSDGITQRNEHLLYEDTQNIDDLEIVIIRSQDGSSTIGQSSDYEDVRELAEGGSNYFNNKIAVVDRGDTSFVDKATAAEDAGCAGLIVVNNDPTAYEFNFGMSWSSGDSYDVPEIPVVFVLYSDREVIWDYCMEQSEGEDAAVLTASVEVIQNQVADNPNAYEMSTFSSDGAKYDLTMIPTISAPGSSIRGATIGEANSQGIVEDLDTTSVGYLSGTSMATPNYAGVAALLIGEQGFGTEDSAERREYASDLTSIFMSTAQVYDADLTSYGTIEESIATNNNSTPNDTSDDYDVTIYTPDEDEVVTEDVVYSPRKQGAGVVDATKAINTEVYLEGLEVNDDGTWGDEGTGFAKVELRNNDLLKNEGKLDFEMIAHNNTGSAVNYNVTFSLLTPQLTSYHTNENELANYVSDEAQFEGYQVSSDRDSYRIMNLDNFNADSELTTELSLGSVTLQAGENKVDLGEYTLTDAQKSFITDNFENGTYVEGYITLTPVTETDSTPTLNVPYMGFYGDYASADAVEPFDFEKEAEYDRTSGSTEGKLYGSDLVNYLGQNSYSKSTMDVASMITVTSYDSYQDNNTAKGSMLQNNNNPYSYGTTPATTYDEDTDQYTLYVGGDSSDVLYIQEFVYRSLDSATVEIIDETGNVVKSKNLTSMIQGSTNLYKSLVNTSYISSYIISDRAYAELPLYLDSGVKISDGEYTLRFTYNLVYGSTQTKDYGLVIDNSAPELLSKSIVNINGNPYVRLQFDEIYLPQDSISSRVVVNAGLITNYIYTETADGFVIDIPYNEDTFNNGKLHVTLLDGARSYARFAINQASLESGLFVSSSSLVVGYNYSYTETDNLANHYEGWLNTTYDITFTNYSGNEISIGTFDAYVTYKHNLSATDTSVYGIKEDGTEVQISDFSILGDGQTIKVTTSYTSIRIVDTSMDGTAGSTTVGNQTSDGSVSIAATTNGSVYVDKVSGSAGDRVTIYAIPDDGYEVGSVTVNGVEVATDEYGNYPFTLTAGQNEVVVTFVQVS